VKEEETKEKKGGEEVDVEKREEEREREK